MLKFHNTLSNQLEEFHPLNDNEVRMYICGPTVWNFAHIGNFRTFVFGDILRRYLKFKGYNLTHVMNLTDVDDRIIRESNKQNISIDEMTAPFIVAFWEDLDSLNCERPEVAPRATEHIAEMISMIETLLENGYAYESDGSIYYRISAFPEYGKLSKIKFEGNIVGGSERVDTDKYEKEDARDFALWKLVDTEDSASWDASFGRGRPGWHIECSAMAMKYLGETFDIHAGGIDLQFPHHENEIAQSEGATGKCFAKTWLHGEFLKIDGEKMAKTLGNEFTLRDIIKRGVQPLAVRYLLLSVPYNKQLNFTFENLSGAETTIERLHDFKKRLQEAHLTDGINTDLQEKVRGFLEDFETAMDDNLNTSVALAALHNLVREVNTALAHETVLTEDRSFILHTIDRFNSVFGIFIESKEVILETEIKGLIEDRREAKNNRDYEKADDIRNYLLSDGIEIEDTKLGARWKRIKEIDESEKRIAVILRRFAGQKVSGSLFSVNREITLPFFDEIISDPKDMKIDHKAISRDDEWWVEVKLIQKPYKFSPRIIQQMKDYLEKIRPNKINSTVIWLAFFGELPIKFTQELSYLGIFSSSLNQIEELERILGIKS